MEFDLDICTYIRENPEKKLLNFITVVTNILNCSHNCDLGMLYRQVQNMEVMTDPLGLDINQDSIILKPDEVKRLLLSKDMVTSLKAAVTALLQSLQDQIASSEIQHHRTMLNCVAKISTFLNICEKNNVAIAQSCGLNEFLNTLMCMLRNFDTSDFVAKALVYKLAAKIIGSFREVSFARHVIIIQLSKELELFYTLLVDLSRSKSRYDMSCFENFLLYLSILKELEEHNLFPSSFETTATVKKDYKIFANIIKTLRKIIEKSPPYVQVVIQECLCILS